MTDPIRDDTTPAFPPPKIIGEIIGEFVPSGNGPLTPAMDKWEPFPLHAQFDMPPARAAFPVFVPANLVTALLEAHKRGDRDGFAAALDALADAVDPPNSNSGARAPIQELS